MRNHKILFQAIALEKLIVIHNPDKKLTIHRLK